MRFEDAYEGWTEKLNQEEAARLPDVCPRTFRRTTSTPKPPVIARLLIRC